MRSGVTPSASSPPIRLRAMLPPPMKAMSTFFILVVTRTIGRVAMGRRLSHCARGHGGSPLTRTLAEQCAPRPDQGRPYRDSRLEVARHAHRQSVHVETVPAQVVEEVTEHVKITALRRNVAALRRQAHEPALPQARQRR